MFLNKQQDNNNEPQEEDIIDFNEEYFPSQNETIKSGRIVQQQVEDDGIFQFSQRSEKDIPKQPEIVDFGQDDIEEEITANQQVQDIRANDTQTITRKSMKESARPARLQQPEVLIKQPQQRSGMPRKKEEEVQISSRSNSPQGRRNDSRQNSITRIEFNTLQKVKMQDSKRLTDSPIRLFKNNSFFKDKDNGDIDFSQFGNDELVSKKQEEFSYKIDSQASLHKFDLQEENSQSNPSQILNNDQQLFINPYINPKRIQKREPAQYNKETNISQRSDFNQNEKLTKSPKKKIHQPQTQLPLKIEPQILKDLQIVDMKNWLYTPVPQGCLVQCYIQRDTSGMGHFYPKYSFFLSDSNRFLMSARKMSLQKTSRYIMSLDNNKINRDSPQCLGIIRSNFLGTEFMVYDNGENPKKTNGLENTRTQLALIHYESNMLQTRTPRKMRVIIPAIIEGQTIPYRPLQSREGIVLESQSSLKRNQTYFEFHNIQPVWNPKAKGFILYFNERVDKASVKNFQLMQISETGHPMYMGQSLFQFGRYGKQGFNIDIQHPFTPLQAFALCVSNFDYKLGCE